jgi:hypothetical protein
MVQFEPRGKILIRINPDTIYASPKPIKVNLIVASVRFARQPVYAGHFSDIFLPAA